uniref:Uncharacterized protein n=1 Tax=Anguilla anguilla TaxID=7936 RepID=A0A0E9SDT6_ANGAN
MLRPPVDSSLQWACRRTLVSNQELVSSEKWATPSSSEVNVQLAAPGPWRRMVLLAIEEGAPFTMIFPS